MDVAKATPWPGLAAAIEYETSVAPIMTALLECVEAHRRAHLEERGVEGSSSSLIGLLPVPWTGS
jgi:hypothetical protein